METGDVVGEYKDKARFEQGQRTVEPSYALDRHNSVDFPECVFNVVAFMRVLSRSSWPPVWAHQTRTRQRDHRAAPR